MSDSSNNFQEKIKIFRERYPEGKISVNVSQGNGCVMARARIYPKYNDEERCFISEITVAKTLSESSMFAMLISETQMEAITLAIKNAGICLNQENTKDVTESQKPDEMDTEDNSVEKTETNASENRELTYEEKYKKALTIACPIARYKEKNYNLGQVLGCDPKAIKWLAEKFTGDTEVKEAAQLICDYAVRKTA